MQHSFIRIARSRFLLQCLIASVFVGFMAMVAEALPNGTWLSKPQLAFHLSNGTLNSVMDRIRMQRYRVVFLDVRNLSDLAQRQVTYTARQYQLVPIAWIQSPQFRALSVQQIMDEGRYADGIQVDDHFFSHYSRSAFYALRSQYPKYIFCSIQPFQAASAPQTGCNQRDVQCYSPIGFDKCVELADRLKAVTSLAAQSTLSYSTRMGGRAFNVFLWPHSDEFVTRSPMPSRTPSAWQTVFPNPMPTNAFTR